ncbi:hypothetical protein [uncultured Winogradskyella sp.]|uniref:hypothetical protein n=1 Tax=uncultured Winogradskyella sp. TaxID=395353 RepID=UPI00261FC40C|nr:hypothetical protein [uncultured Winogradskyella sp.]
MKTIFTLLLLINTVVSYSQMDSIAMKKLIDKSFVSDEDTNELNFINKFELDSSEVKIWKYKTRITSEVFLPKSGTELSITLYSDNDSIYLIRIIEKSSGKNKMEEAFKETELFYNNDELIEESVVFGMPACLWQDHINDFFEYNKNLTIEVLSQLAFRICKIAKD